MQYERRRESFYRERGWTRDDGDQGRRRTCRRVRYIRATGFGAVGAIRFAIAPYGACAAARREGRRFRTGDPGFGRPRSDPEPDRGRFGKGPSFKMRLGNERLAACGAGPPPPATAGVAHAASRTL